jgi:hypothetical protein
LLDEIPVRGTTVSIAGGIGWWKVVDLIADSLITAPGDRNSSSTYRYFIKQSARSAPPSPLHTPSRMRVISPCRPRHGAAGRRRPRQGGASCYRHRCVAGYPAGRDDPHSGVHLLGAVVAAQRRRVEDGPQSALRVTAAQHLAHLCRVLQGIRQGEMTRILEGVCSGDGGAERADCLMKYL